MKAEIKHDGIIVLTPETGAEAYACMKMETPVCIYDMSLFPQTLHVVNANQWTEGAAKLVMRRPEFKRGA